MSGTSGVPAVATSASASASISPSASASAPAPSAGTPSTSILVSDRQTGNPLLTHLRMSWKYASNITPDFIVGQTAAILFLSLRFHGLHGDYIFTRIRELGTAYRTRVLLCLVDMDDSALYLQQLARVCINAKLTLLLAWSNLEAARYVETFKVMEGKPPDAIMERVNTDFVGQVTHALTAIRSVNKTDANTLLATFGSMRALCAASTAAMAQCPGLGEKKVKRIYQALHTPFVSTTAPPTSGGSAAPPAAAAATEAAATASATGTGSTEREAHVADADQPVEPADVPLVLGAVDEGLEEPVADDGEEGERGSYGGGDSADDMDADRGAD